MHIAVAVALAAEGCDLCRYAVDDDDDAAKVVPQLIDCLPIILLAEGKHLLRMSVGRDIVIVRRKAEQKVTHGTADEIGLIACTVEGR